jgi:hypothetical protein
MDQTVRQNQAQYNAGYPLSPARPKRPSSAHVVNATRATKRAELDALVHEDPVRARLEFMKHLEGDLAIRPLPAEAGQRRAEITGRVKPSSRLAGEPANSSFGLGS